MLVLSASAVIVLSFAATVLNWLASGQAPEVVEPPPRASLVQEMVTLDIGAIAVKVPRRLVEDEATKEVFHAHLLVAEAQLRAVSPLVGRLL